MLYNRNQKVKPRLGRGRSFASTNRTSESDYSGGLVNDEIRILSINSLDLSASCLTVSQEFTTTAEITDDDDEENDILSSFDRDQSPNQSMSDPAFKVIQSQESLSEPVFTQQASRNSQTFGDGNTSNPSSCSTQSKNSQNTSPAMSSVKNHVVGSCDYLESIESILSVAPSSHENHVALLPISHSAVDLVIILQRLCGFSQSLFSMVIGNAKTLSSTFNKSPSSFFKNTQINTSNTLHVPQRLQTKGKISKLTESNLHNSESQHEQSSNSNDGFNQFENSQSNYSENSSPYSYIHRQDSEKGEIHKESFNSEKLKLSLHLRVFKVIYLIFYSYTNSYFKIKSIHI